jgi:hypothetical protein
MTEKSDPFFIGWSGKMTLRDRRTFLLGAFGLIAAGGGTGYALGRFQGAAGYGAWEMDREVTLSGPLIKTPFPMLQIQLQDRTLAHIYLVANNKCGAQDRVVNLDTPGAVITGTPLIRGKAGMLAISDHHDAVRPLAQPAPLSTDVDLLGAVESQAVVLDAKCFLGAMRPNERKIHKACAALCIRGGIPPLVYLADQPRGQRLALLVDARGAAHGDDLLPLVADPLRVSGTAIRIGGLLTLRASISDMRRLG